jgi:tetratricopeptide (TPR) repeat protein
VTAFQKAVDCTKERQQCFDFATANSTKSCHRDWELLADIHAMHGIAQIKAGDNSGAIESLQASLDMDTVQPDALAKPKRTQINWRHIGLAKGQLGDVDAEIDAYQRAIDIDPAYVQGIKSLAGSIIDRGLPSDYEDALALLKQGRRQSLSQVDEKYFLWLEGMALNRLGNMAQAAHHFQMSWDINLPPAYQQMDAQTTFMLGALLLQIGDIEGAIKADEEASSLDPSNFQALSNLGTALHAKATQLDNQRKVIPHKVFKRAAAA